MLTQRQPLAEEYLGIPTRMKGLFLWMRQEQTVFGGGSSSKSSGVTLKLCATAVSHLSTPI
jgi:hypothetical protein